MCRIHLTIYRTVVALTGRAEGLEMPEEMKIRLLFLAARGQGGKLA